jgi:hypothetical protein
MPDITLDDFDRLEATVAALLGRAWTAQDHPALRRALRQQQALLDVILQALGQREELIGGLTRENEALRQVVLDADDPRPWDFPDERRW